ncbi:hypothetical protein D791_01960 [Nitrincola nitratireducens]|uniref:Uncharacterized protein n=1 Tax=Nitrincola nitratireducens TaxID=1229521 RepID=W9UVA2_9GAMM|nr:hypothetical protein D791_01960 [Nitrincola nitratireducens]
MSQSRWSVNSAILRSRSRRRLSRVWPQASSVCSVSLLLLPLNPMYLHRLRVGGWPYVAGVAAGFWHRCAFYNQHTQWVWLAYNHLRGALQECPESSHIFSYPNPKLNVNLTTYHTSFMFRVKSCFSIPLERQVLQQENLRLYLGVELPHEPHLGVVCA